jgi:hypothetical protein
MLNINILILSPVYIPLYVSLTYTLPVLYFESTSHPPPLELPSTPPTRKRIRGRHRPFHPRLSRHPAITSRLALKTPTLKNLLQHARHGDGLHFAQLIHAQQHLHVARITHHRHHIPHLRMPIPDHLHHPTPPALLHHLPLTRNSLPQVLPVPWPSMDAPHFMVLLITLCLGMGFTDPCVANPTPRITV